MELSKDKLKRISDLMSSIEKNHGAGAIRLLGEESKTRFPTRSSGDMAVDNALGGGYGKGRVVEIFGPESSGKTTLALHAIAEAQRNGEACAFVDVEHAIDPLYSKALGVDMDNLLIAQPDYGEQALDIAYDLISSNEIGIVVIDSVAALVPKAELDGEMGDQQMGLQARLMSKAMRKLTGVISKNGTTLIMINQTRQKIGVMFGSPETTAGGVALKFFASQRIRVSRTGSIKNGDEITANETKVDVKKNKLAAPFKIANILIRFGTGIDANYSLLEQAKKSGVLIQKGAWISYNGENIAQGKEKMITLMENDSALKMEIDKKVRDELFSIKEDVIENEKEEVNEDVEKESKESTETSKPASASRRKKKKDDV